MSWNFLRIRPIALSFAVVLFAGATGFGADALQKIRIAYASRSSSALPQYMALQRGYFKEQGLDVEIIQMNPRFGASAVVSGEVSFATPFTRTLCGILQGLSLKLVVIPLQ